MAAVLPQVVQTSSAVEPRRQRDRRPALISAWTVQAPQVDLREGRRARPGGGDRAMVLRARRAATVRAMGGSLRQRVTTPVDPIPSPGRENGGERWHDGPRSHPAGRPRLPPRVGRRAPSRPAAARQPKPLPASARRRRRRGQALPLEGDRNEALILEGSRAHALFSDDPGEALAQAVALGRLDCRRDARREDPEASPGRERSRRRDRRRRGRPGAQAQASRELGGRRPGPRRRADWQAGQRHRARR